MRVVRERLWVIVLCVVVCVGVTVVYVSTADQVFEAESDLLVSPIARDTEALVGLPLVRESSDPTRDVETVSRLVTSSAVAEPGSQRPRTRRGRRARCSTTSPPSRSPRATSSPSRRPATAPGRRRRSRMPSGERDRRGPDRATARPARPGSRSPARPPPGDGSRHAGTRGARAPDQRARDPARRPRPDHPAAEPGRPPDVARRAAAGAEHRRQPDRRPRARPRRSVRVRAARPADTARGADPPVAAAAGARARAA